MGKNEILSQLKEWDVDPDQYESLEWSDLQSFFKAVKKKREAASAATEASEIGPDSDSGSDESELSDDSLDEDEELEDGLQSIAPESDDIAAPAELEGHKVITACTLKAIGDIRVVGVDGEASYRRGQRVELALGDIVSCDSEFLAFLRAYKVV